MLKLLTIMALLLPPVRLEGLATTYYPGDGHSGSVLGCPGEARRLLGTAEFRSGQPIIATRHAPKCGTLVIVENQRTGAKTLALRLDTGPWGCIVDGTRKVLGPSECSASNGRRIADVDLSRHVAQEIGARGKEKVRLRWR